MQLREEISFLRQQVDIKDRQISELHALLQTSQRQLPPVMLSTVREQAHEEELSMPAPNVASGGTQREMKRRWSRRLFWLE